GDDNGSFRSMTPPPLGYPDMVSLEPHGVLSVHTPNHLVSITNECLFYLSLLTRLSIKGISSGILNRREHQTELNKFLLNYFVFQEAYYEFDLKDGHEIIATDHDPRAEK